MPPSVTVDFRQKGSSDRVFSQPPLLRSHDSDWRTIHLEHHYQPAIETPEHTWTTPVIAIALGSALQLQGNRGSSHPFQQETQLAIFPAGMPHQYTTQNTAEFLAFSIDTQAFIPFISDLATLIPTLSLQVDALILGIGLALKAELVAGCPGGSLYETSLATALATHLLRRYSTAIPQTAIGLSKPKLKLVLEYIDDHLSEKIRLEAIAQLLNMSQFHFCHLFKESMGVAPYQYILHQRVERAKQLLRYQTLPIIDVALECGFATQSQLTKYFNRLVGTTPKVYRDQA
ncbi:MAG: helix-turn-helix domain-containing protein [Leptolyngbya sp. BL-A-14]